MSQAALSSAIRELESQLDCNLFERTTRNVKLTEAGHQFLPTAVRVVEELEWSSMQLKEIHRLRCSRLRVGFTPTLASHAFPEMLELFQKAHPHVHIDVMDVKRHNVKVRCAMTVSHLETAVALAERGIGVTVIPSFATAVCRRYKVNVTRLQPPIRFNFCRIVKSGRPPNENLEHFTNLVIDRLRDTESPRIVQAQAEGWS
jgi:DNA-binding transcriptional LysR family regulator